MKRRSSVHQYRVTLDDILQNAPNNWILAIDNLLCRLNSLNDTALDELADNEWLVKLGSHILRNTHLVHLKLWAYDDNRTRRVVNTLTEQVLTETSLLTLKRVRKRLKRTVRLVLYGIALTRVVEQRVYSLLQHTLLVAENHLRSLNLDKTLKTVVTYDHATIQIVEIRCGETTTIEWHQRTQLRWNDWNIRKYHPLRLVLTVRGAERLDDVKTLQSLGLTLLRRLLRGAITQCVRHRVEVHLLKQREDCLATHIGYELVWIVIVERLIALWQCSQDVEILLL